MIRKIILVAFGGIVGLAFSALIDATLRKLIQWLYVFTTRGKIQLVGKDFYLVEHPVYYISFAFSLMVVGICLMKLPARKWFIQLLVYIVLFITTLCLVSWAMAYLTVITCTRCDDGTMPVYYNHLPYAIIIVIGLFMATIVLSLLTWKYKKNLSE